MKIKCVVYPLALPEATFQHSYMLLLFSSNEAFSIGVTLRFRQFRLVMIKINSNNWITVIKSFFFPPPISTLSIKLKEFKVRINIILHSAPRSKPRVYSGVKVEA